MFSKDDVQMHEILSWLASDKITGQHTVNNHLAMPPVSSVTPDTAISLFAL